jgi:hypothetical protein
MVEAVVFLIRIVRALVEVAGLVLLGQGVLYLIAGPRREGNAMYRAFAIVSGPPVRLVRMLVPRAIGDRFVPIITGFALLLLWIGLAWLRLVVCAAPGSACS